MQKTFALAAAAVLAMSLTANAQSVSSSTGTASNISGIQSTVSANQMGGMRVTGVLETGSITGLDLWRQLDATTWGADIWSGNRHIAQVYMSPAAPTPSHRLRPFDCTKRTI